MVICVELGILCLGIIVGARLGGIGLGAISGLGLILFVFIFRMSPGSPPGTVLGTIIVVIIALAALQAAGGLHFLVGALLDSCLPRVMKLSRPFHLDLRAYVGAERKAWTFEDEIAVE
jgi:anaerobic C4-dicarboxylate transporter